MLSCTRVGELRNELLELNRQLNRKRARRGQPLLTPDQHRQESLKVARLNEFLGSLQTLLDAFLALELELILQLERVMPQDLATKTLALEPLLEQQETQLTYLLDYNNTQSGHALVLLVGASSVLENLGALFLELLPLLELKAERHLLYRLTRRGAKKSKEPLRLPRQVCLHTPESAEVLFFSHDKDAGVQDSELVGWIVKVQGKRAQLCLKQLVGTWCWRQAQQTLEMQVSLEQGSIERLELTRDLGRRKKGEGEVFLTLDDVNSTLSSRMFHAEVNRNNRRDILKKMFDFEWERFISMFVGG